MIVTATKIVPSIYIVSNETHSKQYQVVQVKVPPEEIIVPSPNLHLHQHPIQLRHLQPPRQHLLRLRTSSFWQVIMGIQQMHFHWVNAKGTVIMTDSARYVLNTA